MKLLEESKGGEELALLTTLRAVTEGKIYVEVEWARLTRRLARIREGEGKVDEAAEIMQEVHVETYGAMEKREKTEFLLEQVRLCLDKKDMVRTELIANKITQKVLDEPLLQDVRLAYYQLMVRYHTLKASDIDLARDHYAMYVTPGVGSWEASLRRAVVQTALSPYGKDSTQLMAKLAAEVRLASLPTYRAIVDAYITQEVAGWPALRAAHGAQLAADHPDLFAQPDSPAWKKLHASVVQRNIKVISTYYSRITTGRLAELLDLPEAEAEAHLSKLVIDGLVWAKIDRPGKVVVFRKMQNPDALLNEWGSDITKLLNLVEKTVHVVGMDIQKHKVTI
jgi:26S proteasome regulatory subunit N5